MKTLAKWSVAQYHQMIEAQILNDQSVELLAGEIVEMSPESPLHYNTAKRGVRYLEELLKGKAEVRFNGAITLADSEPEPDIAIVKLPESRYDEHHPYPEDIYWLVEVANTSLQKDLELKKSIYAAANIPEYWVLDLAIKKIHVFRNPQGNDYLNYQICDRGELASLAFPEFPVSLEKLF